jgi:hypothetical protein
MRTAIKLLTLVAASFTLASPALAQFNPGPNPVTGAEVGQRTLAGGAGHVTGTGSITTAGSAVTVLISGVGTVLTNDGTIQQTGTGRAIDNTVNNSSLTILNNGTIQSVTTDAVRVNTANTSITLTNSGTIRVTGGGQAIDWAAISTGANTLNNLVTGVITAVGEDAVRPGTNGIVNNAGTIAATPTGGASPSGSDGIDLRTFSGIQITNSGTITGRHGIATDGSNAGPSTVTVTNQTGGLIAAINGSGINIDGVSQFVTANVINAFGATIQGGALAGATESDGDGIDVDGVLTLDNAGRVLGLGARGGANNAEGLAAGGGTIINRSTGQIVGSTLAADAPNGDPTRAGHGILIDDSNGGAAVAVTTVLNAGLIEGKTGFAIKMIGNHDDTIVNDAGGTIRGAGTGAAVQTGGGVDRVTNRGAIISTIGNAIDLEAGDDVLTIAGGSASVVGNISGGAGLNTLVIDPGTGNTFEYANKISLFGTVEILSGEVILSGDSDYTGTTRVSGGRFTLDDADLLSWDSSLDLNGGTFHIANAAGVNGQTFNAFSLSQHSIIELDFSALTFSALGGIMAGRTLTIFDYFAPTSYALRFAGDLSANADFLALVNATTIDGIAATFVVGNGFTDVLPAPEPGTVGLLALGIGALIVVRRRWL